MRRRAAAPQADDGQLDPAVGDLLRLCVQGIAAGMRTTG
jgi:phosphoenolpyruvate carboxylase